MKKMNLDERPQTADYRQQTIDYRRKKKRNSLKKISGFKRDVFVCLLTLSSIVYSLSSLSFVFAEEKSWNNQGDGATWTDDANWLPAGAPGEEDDAIVNYRNASTGISESYNLQSLMIGGKRASTVTVSNFTSGNIIPDNPSDDAVFNRKDGKLVLKGSASKLKLKGSYKDSEEVIPDEPSFMLYVK